MQDTSDNKMTDFLDLTSDIVSSYVANNSVPMADLPALIASVHSALAGLSKPKAAAEEPSAPPVPIKARYDLTTSLAWRTGAATNPCGATSPRAGSPPSSIAPNGACGPTTRWSLRTTRKRALSWRRRSGLAKRARDAGARPARRRRNGAELRRLLYRPPWGRQCRRLAVGMRCQKDSEMTAPFRSRHRTRLTSLFNLFVADPRLEEIRVGEGDLTGSLRSHPAAVHHQVHARQVCGFFRSKEEGGPRHVLWPSEPRHRRT
jgi:hypothetical protein